jgi:hypothetical protein
MIDIDKWEDKANRGDGLFAIACALNEIAQAIHRSTNNRPAHTGLVAAIENIGTAFPTSLTVETWQSDDDENAGG